ncbi:uncharacterized protein LOC107267218 isoform X2 [Cephus cinctus]|uniref:Uncharacterized protein LOC107267218 isoform X2 n=1 Tax=Cephus cinctus TaxID=211228 RepID=A0AAJ7RFS1_CEPCN|nr:uncharacterized protein LOC107267218 isoform X2 [Cephus cinctus]
MVLLLKIALCAELQESKDTNGLKNNYQDKVLRPRRQVLVGGIIGPHGAIGGVLTPGAIGADYNGGKYRKYKGYRPRYPPYPPYSPSGGYSQNYNQYKDKEYYTRGSDYADYDDVDYGHRNENNDYYHKYDNQNQYSNNGNQYHGPSSHASAAAGGFVFPHKYQHRPSYSNSGSHASAGSVSFPGGSASFASASSSSSSGSYGLWTARK